MTDAVGAPDEWCTSVAVAGLSFGSSVAIATSGDGPAALGVPIDFIPFGRFRSVRPEAGWLRLGNACLRSRFPGLHDPVRVVRGHCALECLSRDEVRRGKDQARPVRERGIHRRLFRHAGLLGMASDGQKGEVKRCDSACSAPLGPGTDACALKVPWQRLYEETPAAYTRQKWASIFPLRIVGTGRTGSQCGTAGPAFALPKRMHRGRPERTARHRIGSISGGGAATRESPPAWNGPTILLDESAVGRFRERNAEFCLTI